MVENIDSNNSIPYSLRQGMVADPLTLHVRKWLRESTFVNPSRQVMVTLRLVLPLWPDLVENITKYNNKIDSINNT